MKSWYRRRPRAADDGMFEPDQIDSGARPLVSTLLVLLAVIVMAVQNWSDRAQTDQLMADRLDNVSLLLSGRIGDRLMQAESALEAMDALAGRVERVGAPWPKDKVIELQRMRNSVTVQWGGSELAVLDSQGRVLAETDQSVRDNIDKLRPELDALTRGGVAGATRSLFVRSARGHALALLRPWLAADGTVAAVLVFMAPMDGWRELLDGLKVFPYTEIALLDRQRQVLVSLPGSPPVKSVVAPLSPGFEGSQNLAFVPSPVDGQVRLVKERQIALPWPAGERYWIFRYGHPQGAYLSGWWLSVAFNGVVTLLVLAMWALNACASRQRWRTVGQLTRSTQLLQQTLDSLPAPAALVKPQADTIYRANLRLLDRFGAQAAAGSQVSRLFEKPADWEQLKQLGQGKALSMLSRSGAFHARARCVALDRDGLEDSYWLLTLVDVTAQVERKHSLPTPDPLAGLAHQGRLVQLTANALERAEPAALMVLDLDQFELVNQINGSAAGDRMLVSVGQMLRLALPANAVVACLGGGEFAVLLMDAKADEAYALAQQMRAAVADAGTLSAQGQALRHTVSIGVAVRQAGEHGMESLMARAGAALARAQAGGRDQCALAN